MKILAIGDLVGEGSIQKLRSTLENIQIAENIDFTVVNGENVSQGMGMTTKDFNELCKFNIDVITMGNHTWGKKDIFTLLDNPKIIRPANYTEGLPGRGYTVVEKNGKRFLVINLIGRTEMNVLSDNPFTCVDNILNTVQADVKIVDFHAEASAEKVAMSYYLDGRVSVLFGTHTHVQTADEKVLENGTGYITDIGMTGPIKSVIGMDIDVSFKRFISSLPERYKLAEGEQMLNGAVFEIDENTNMATKVYRIQV